MISRAVEPSGLSPSQAHDQRIESLTALLSSATLSTPNALSLLFPSPKEAYTDRFVFQLAHIKENSYKSAVLTPKTAEKFVSSLLKNLAKNSDHLVNILASQDSIFSTRTLEILDSVICSDHGGDGVRFSFQKVIVPLLAFFASPQVSKSLSNTYGSIIISIWLQRPQFWGLKFIPNIKKMVERGWISRTATSAFEPVCFTQVFIPALDLLETLITRYPTFSEMPSVIESIALLSDVVYQWKDSLGKSTTLVLDSGYSCDLVVSKMKKLNSFFSSRYEFKGNNPLGMCKFK
jgi:hypothetical protein